jgi:hypothetical protein
MGASAAFHPRIFESFHGPLTLFVLAACHTWQSTVISIDSWQFNCGNHLRR